MNSKRSIYIVTLLTLVLAFAPPTAQSSGQECDVQVKEPRAGQDVALHGIIQGTAKLPLGGHVWAFVRPVFTFRTLEKWWPQGEAAITPTTGEWELSATFGSPQQNIGEQFDVTAAAFGPQQHAELVAYLV